MSPGDRPSRQPARQPAIQVIYVAGTRNCGSTMLDAVLGNAPGARSLGEAGGFHRYLSGAAPACACSRLPSGCGPCQAAAAAASRACGSEVAFASLSALPLRERCLHWVAVPTAARRRYARAADALLAAVAAETGAGVLVDSSKNSGRAAALALDSAHRVRVLHLVRDPRGCIDSRRRRAAAGGERPMVSLTVGAWLVKNAALSALGRRLGASRYLRCRYEDLVSDLPGTLAAIGAWSGLDTSGLADRALTGSGVDRRHLYEPARQVDYGRVRIEPARLAGQRWSAPASRRFWLLGGWMSRAWGYDRSQSYLPAEEPAAP